MQQKQIEDVAPDQLLACTKLLALALAEHRARFGGVALATHADAVPALQRAPREFPLAGAADAVLREALALIAGTPAEPRAVPDARDKRQQARISLAAPVKLSDPDGQRVIDATLLNISWGGASVRSAEPLGEAGRPISLHLPVKGAQTIRILANILRVEDTAGGAVYGLRFDSLEPGDEDRLQEILNILLRSAPADARRAEARLVQKLDIEYGDSGEFRATLEDISPSGLMLTVPQAFDVGQSILITLSCLESPLNLSLRARVMHRSQLGSEGFFMYRVGLKFEHPDATLRERVTDVLRHLALRHAPSPPAR